MTALKAVASSDEVSSSGVGSKWRCQKQRRRNQSGGGIESAMVEQEVAEGTKGTAVVAESRSVGSEAASEASRRHWSLCVCVCSSLVFVCVRRWCLCCCASCVSPAGATAANFKNY